MDFCSCTSVVDFVSRNHSEMKPKVQSERATLFDEVSFIVTREYFTNFFLRSIICEERNDFSGGVFVAVLGLSD